MSVLLLTKIVYLALSFAEFAPLSSCSGHLDALGQSSLAGVPYGEFHL